MLPLVTVLEVASRSLTDVRPAVLEVLTERGKADEEVDLLPSTVARRVSVERPVLVFPLRPVEGVEERPEVLPVVPFLPVLAKFLLL